MCSIEQPYRNVRINFVFFELRGVNAKSGPTFLTSNKKDLHRLALRNSRARKGTMYPSWPMDTCRITIVYMTNLGMGTSRVTIAHVL